jgi:hypothetical protein
MSNLAAARLRLFGPASRKARAPKPYDHMSKAELYARVELLFGRLRRAGKLAAAGARDAHQGRERALMFYKAAFYDRSAHISPSRRFSIRKIYIEGSYDMQHEILDGGKQRYITAVVPFGTRNGGNSPDWKAMEGAEKTQRAECAAWLVSNGFTKWEDVSAHWND